MRAGHVLYSGLGGHGSVFFSIAKAPARSGVQHYPIFYGIEALRKEYQDNCAELGLDLVSIKKKSGSYLGPTLTLVRSFFKLGVDAVVVHSGASLPAAAMFRLLKPRSVLLFVEHQAPKFKSKPEWLASLVAHWVCHKVIYLTKSSQQQIKEKLGPFYRPSRAALIPNGIDIERFCPRPQGPKAVFALGMAARMNDLKDHETLIRALAFTGTQGDRLHLFLAGDGPTRVRLELLAEELNIAEKITFMGVLNEDALICFYQGLDLYLHCTFGEMMSTSVMQAQACGLPVIASDVPHLAEQISHGEDGILVPSSDPNALIRAITSLRDNAHARGLMSKTARKKAEAAYSHHVMRQDYDNLIISIVDR